MSISRKFEIKNAGISTADFDPIRGQKYQRLLIVFNDTIQQETIKNIESYFHKDLKFLESFEDEERLDFFISLMHLQNTISAMIKLDDFPAGIKNFSISFCQAKKFKLNNLKALKIREVVFKI